MTEKNFVVRHGLEVYGDANVSGSADVSGNVNVGGNLNVSGSSYLSGGAVIRAILVVIPHSILKVIHHYGWYSYSFW